MAIQINTDIYRQGYGNTDIHKYCKERDMTIRIATVIIQTMIIRINTDITQTQI